MNAITVRPNTAPLRQYLADASPNASPSAVLEGASRASQQGSPAGEAGLSETLRDIAYAANIAAIDAANAKPSPEVDCEHQWEWVRDWIGDPNVVNGTQDCSGYVCTRCGSTDCEDPPGDDLNQEYEHEEML